MLDSEYLDMMSDREQTAAREALKWREAAERAEERAADMEARALRAETSLADLTAWLRQGKPESSTVNLSGIDAKAIHKALLEVVRSTEFWLGLA